MSNTPKGLERVDHPGLDIPIYIKLAEDAGWPAHKVFYLLAGNELFLCRNHELFRSSVPAPNWPGQLAEQKPFLHLRYPRLERRLFEQAVGFCYRVYRQHGSEAGLLLAWSPRTGRLRLVCPPQEGRVSQGWSGRFPLALRYEIPDLGGDMLVGDLHSHGNEAAYASSTDKDDEAGRDGLHVVLGRLGDLDTGGLPDVHVDAVVDGRRFNVRPELVIEGYEGPCLDFPGGWMEQLTVKVYGGAGRRSWGSGWNGDGRDDNDDDGDGDGEDRRWPGDPDADREEPRHG